MEYHPSASPFQKPVVMPEKVAIITDSTCDIPSIWRTQYNLQVIPLTIVWGDRQYLDGIDIQPDEFYARLPQSDLHPTTSQPAPQNFRAAYDQAVTDGARSILVFTLSSAMSGTYSSAVQAATDSPVPITVVDSKSNSMGLGWQVLAAARALANGRDAAAALAAAEKVREGLVYLITLDTLEYLDRGGRIGGAAQFIGNLLKIKPLIYVNHDTGKVEAGIPARTRGRAVEGLYKDFFHRLDGDGKLHLVVLHNDAADEAEHLAERVNTEYNPAELFISLTSPILGAHTGPRALALCGYREA